jgi:hypothetical protein
MTDTTASAIPHLIDAASAADPFDSASVHKAFRWTGDAGHIGIDAVFLDTTLDIATGINTCLEMVYASNLERLANEDADPGTSVKPAIGVVEADHLMRLSIAASSLLRDDVRRRVEEAQEA